MKKKRIMIVDDDRSVRESLSRVLAGENYEVVEAADGQEALDKFETGPMDMLLLDIGLPIRNGWETFERITTKNPLVPIIIITGQSEQFDVAMAAGVGALMEKPLDVPLLLQTMRELLAEPGENRLRRLTGQSNDTRCIPCDSSVLLKQLREQQGTPYHTKLSKQ